MSVSIKDLQDQVAAHCEARGWASFHTPKNLAIAISTEAAELIEPMRFLNDDETRAHLATREGRENLEDEMSDVLFLLLRLAEREGVDVEAAFSRKMKKNAAKYPLKPQDSEKSVE